MVEVNPTLDVRNSTAELGTELVLSALGMKILVARAARFHEEMTACAFESFRALALGLGVLALVAPCRAQPPGSPHETVKATVDGAQVSIEYGRPYMRGRKIMGGLVPYDHVWRTGADAVHDAHRPSAARRSAAPPCPRARSRSTRCPAEQGWKLIINKQTGQWGTEYNEAQDLARVDMTSKALTAPVDQFTIKIEPAGPAEC